MCSNFRGSKQSGNSSLTTVGRKVTAENASAHPPFLRLVRSHTFGPGLSTFCNKIHYVEFSQAAVHLVGYWHNCRHLLPFIEMQQIVQAMKYTSLLSEMRSRASACACLSSARPRLCGAAPPNPLGDYYMPSPLTL